MASSIAAAAFRSIVRRSLLLSLLALLAVAGLARGQQSPPPPAPSTEPAPVPLTPQGQTQPLPGAPEPPIKVTTGLVHLVVTVMDHHHEFITDLDKSDFKISENGTPQDIRFFGRETDLPLRIGLLLDTSNSIRPRLDFEKDAAVDFLTQVIRRDKDEAFLMTFDNEPQIIQDYTGDVSLLESAIRDQRAGGGTALNDAIVMASQKLMHPPMPRGPGAEVRRVIVIISDGNDNLSDHALSDATDAAIRSEAAIFTVSTNTDWLSIDEPSRPKKYNLDPGDRILQNFADQTGGQAYFPYRVDDLAQSFVDIGNELRSQYYIAYLPAGPAPRGEYRKIEVDTDRKGLIVRTRKGYYAVAAPAGGPSAQ
ncbi:MAG TPA: VWA domain-containing protein [Candidatus Baltobacteraceae bacterium]|nr:VWA domain-containing protein [Candidatus Baltobacteraceae bacterium]